MATKETLTKAQWEQIEERLQRFFGHVTLRVDGYKLDLYVERFKALRLAIVVYVNGKFEGRWLMEDCEERRRFFRPVTHHLMPARARGELVKKLGKRAAQRNGVFKTYTSYRTYWTSFQALKRHLLKHNESIAWLNPEPGA